jgi:UDP-N-acetylglucosamine acyltransferase
LANSHVAHDCRVGDNVVMANSAMIAGHSKVGDFAILGGGAGLHQYVRVGPHAFIGAMSAVENDVIPYGMVIGNRAYLAGLNIIGLRRRGFSREQIHDLRRAYRLLFADEGTLAERVEDVAEEFAKHPTVHEILDFIRINGDRALCTPRDLLARV